MAVDVETLKGIQSRATAANGRMAMHVQRLQRIYKFAMPFRKTGLKGAGPTTGQDLAEVYDSTAITSTFRSAGRLKNSMFPDGERFFLRQTSALAKGKKAQQLLEQMKVDIDQFKKQLQLDDQVIAAVFEGSEWPVATHEMCLDLMAGHSCLFVPPCNDHVARFIVVPADHVANDVNIFGDVTGVYWPTEWTGRDLLEKYPDAPYPKKLKDELEKDKEKKFPVHINAIQINRDGKKSWLLVYCHPEMDQPIHDEETVTSPWVIGRYYRVPGEERGRGSLDLALPTIETINQTQEFILKAAALAVLGVFLATQDASLNTDTIRLEPGTIIPVQRTGGALGPSLSRLDAPGRFDTSQLIINETRMAIKEMLGDSALPGDAAVRSATEVADRIKRLADDHVGATSRLHKEIVVAVVDRVTELCAKQNLLLLGGPFNQLIVQTKPTSPLAVSARAARLQIVFQWMQAVAQFAPALLPIVAKLEKIAVDFGRDLGVGEEYMRDDGEQKGFEALVQQLVQEALQKAEEARQQLRKQQREALSDTPATQPSENMPV